MDLDNKSFQKYGHFNSTHEIYGVLMEEVQEFFEIVMEKPNTKNKKERMMQELADIESVCRRAKNELKDNKVKFV